MSTTDQERATATAPNHFDGAALFDARVATAPELVIALVSTLGTELEAVVDELNSALRLVGYSLDLVRVSELIHQLHSEIHGETQPTSSNAEQLMTEGDRLRGAIRHGGAACALAIATIQRRRKQATGDAKVERNGVATLVRSVKHPDEVRLLRTVYGSRLLVVAVSASPADREHALLERLQRDHPGKPHDWYAAEAARLLVRDLKDEQRPLGQRTRDAFSQADVFLWVRAGRPLGHQIQRVVELWFGKPFETPVPDEVGMFHAFAAQFRSAASGRQVGAAVVDARGELLVTGTNEVPAPGGGQYWAGDERDFRDFVAGHDANERQKYAIVEDLLRRLQAQGWLSNQHETPLQDLVRESLSHGGPLAGSRVTDLLEFGRIAHAEMAAICTAARRGTPIGGAVLYTTTYPCHECARLIIAAGIDRVVYIDPYPKSQVPELYRSQVSEDGASATRDRALPIVPFEGVAPRLFTTVFRIGARSRDVMGDFSPWTPTPPLGADVAGLMIPFEFAVLEEFTKRLKSATWPARGAA